MKKIFYTSRKKLFHSMRLEIAGFSCTFVKN
jgi:hypothetical protein